MTVDREKKYEEMATRGKYRNLYAHLLGRSGQEWRATFAEIESILGIELPASARLASAMVVESEGRQWSQPVTRLDCSRMGNRRG